MHKASHIEKLRHSGAHILAMAVLRLRPDTKLGIGVPTENGFFHDFEFSQPILQEDLAAIEAEMRIIVQEDLPFTQLYIPREIAINTLLQRGQIYKAELLQDTSELEISFFKTGNEFVDLCRGPHVATSSEVTAFKLVGLSGAYWKGDDSRPQLQRISALAFRSNDDLKEYEQRETMLADLDFRRIGKSLEYISPTSNQLLYTTYGQYINHKICESVLTTIEADKFHSIKVPIVREDAFERYSELFEIRNRSYRELPLRWYNHGLLILKEGIEVAEKTIPTGSAIHLLTYARESEYDIELREQINLLVSVFRKLGLEISVQVLSPDRENDFIRIISSHLETKIISHSIIVNRKYKKVQLIINTTDSFDRSLAMATLTISYPGATLYTNREGELVPTVNVTSEIIVERLFAYFLERDQGDLPFWLAPRKCVIVPITDKFNLYAERVKDILTDIGLNPTLDARAEKMEAKIRDAELKKIPLIVIIGEKEEQNEAVSLRLRGSNEIGMVNLKEIRQIIEQIK